MADVGYGQHLTQRQWASKDKLNLIQSLMKLRKKGSLPPVYPNGWFALLDSDQINVKQVKYVTALGNHFILKNYLKSKKYYKKNIFTSISMSYVIITDICDNYLVCGHYEYIVVRIYLHLYSLIS